jgi:hypothetical protein
MPTDLHCQAQSLLGCPVELCHSIFSYLSQADLRTLCLVHGNLRAIAEQLLYSHIQLTWEQKLQPHPITSLLRSLLRRPQLATYVSRLSLAGWCSLRSSRHNRALKILLSENEVEDCLAFVKKATVPYQEIWLEELRQGTMDAFIAVLLSQPMRLTDLVMNGYFLRESKFIGLVLRSMICNPSAHDEKCSLRLDMSRLERVSLEPICDTGRVKNNARNTADLLPIFYLPSVKQISASIDNPVALSWPAMHAPSPPRLRDLKLDYIREPFLGQLLSSTDNLQSLDWRWCYFEELYDKQYHTRTLDLTQIVESLSYAPKTLSELVISAMNVNDPIEPSLTIQGSMKGLSEYKNLKKLTIPFLFLTRAWSFSTDLHKRMKECLPCSPESLTITEDLGSNDEYDWNDNDMLDILEPWLEDNQAASTPHLRDVKVIIELPWQNPTRIQRLCEQTNMVRVRFESE